MHITKDNKIKALNKALKYLLEDNTGCYGLCNIIPLWAKPQNIEDSKIIRELMSRRRLKVKEFYDHTGIKVNSSDQFQWMPKDKESRVDWLKEQIKILTK